MLPGFLFGQHFFRIEGDITIKEKNEFQSQLTIGRFYYDNNLKKVVYTIHFPEKQVVVTKDTITYHFVGETLKSKIKTSNLTQFTVFNLALNHTLENYGLENSFYHLEKVEKDEGLVIMTWKPEKSKSSLFGNVLISTRAKKLHGVVIYDVENKVVSKQFFEDYRNIKGFVFPHKIVKIGYNGDDKSYQIITFDNVKLNNLDEEYYYDYPVPVY